MRSTGMAAVCVAFACASSVASARPERLPAPITLYGVAGVRPGMTPADVAARWGVEADTPGPGFNGCTGAQFRVGRLHVIALFEQHVFSMASFDGDAHTGNGIRVGSTVRQLRRAYGTRLSSRRQPYASPGTLDYFVRKPSRPYAWLYFSIAHGAVRTISYGNRAVFYEEGCA